MAAENAGNYDVFVRKYNGDGVHVWTKQRGSGGNDFAAGVAVDVNGNIYVVGETEGSLGDSAGAVDAFLWKIAAEAG